MVLGVAWATLCCKLLWLIIGFNFHCLLLDVFGLMPDITTHNILFTRFQFRHLENSKILKIIPPRNMRHLLKDYLSGNVNLHAKFGWVRKLANAQVLYHRLGKFIYSLFHGLNSFQIVVFLFFQIRNKLNILLETLYKEVEKLRNAAIQVDNSFCLSLNLYLV